MGMVGKRGGGRYHLFCFFRSNVIGSELFETLIVMVRLVFDSDGGKTSVMVE